MCKLLVEASPQAMHMGPRLPLELAAGAGAIDTVKLLLALSALIDAQPASGKTALHIAVRSAKVDVSRLLVEAGASVTLKDRSGRVAHEVVPDQSASDFQWLTDLSCPSARTNKPSADDALQVS